MYPASDEFHEAVANGKHQIAMLIFDDDVFFSNADIDVENGIEFNEYFNMEKDIAIGQALSNELSFTLFNDKRLLNDYEFGEFKATLGVRIAEETVTMSGNCMVQDDSNIYVGRNSSPYLWKSGSGVSGGPNWPVKGMLSMNEKLYCFGTDNRLFVYDEVNETPVQETLNSFMMDKARRDFFGKGIRYLDEDRTMYIWENGKKSTYEFVPLGRFIADRPNAPDNIAIDFTCNDLMMKFSGDMPDTETLGITYPTTIKGLLTAVCAYAEVPYDGEDFINSNAEISKKPDAFDGCTMRDVIGWIAEAAASNARISRDGKLILDWLKATEASYDESMYMDFQPYWYETQQIDKVCNRTTMDGTETISGEGENGYLIQDNPLLKGVS